MRSFCTVLLFTVCASFCHSQAQANDAALLAQARAKYDSPFDRGLKSFDCAVSFNWKEHWKETLRVGDEGTDEEIDRLVQPILNRVTVTRGDAIASSGMTDEEEQKMPYKGMAEGLLKHAVSFSLRTWLVASNNSLLPPTTTPVHFNTDPAGYKMGLKIKDFDVEMQLTPAMSLQNMTVKGSDGDRQEFEFAPGPQGFVLRAWTMGEDGNFKPGNRLVFTYTYQSVDGFQIPAQVAINRESHHEVWRYALNNCKVTTEK